MSSSRVSRAGGQVVDVRERPDLIRSVRAEFFAQGISIQDWATERGFKPRLVYYVLRGERRCARGVCHEIAVALGLKDGSHSHPNKAPPPKVHRQNAEAI